MQLSQLLIGLDIVEISNYHDVNILSITDKSNEVNESALFCCIVGEKFDSHTIINNLALMGCKVFLVENINKTIKNDIIQIKVKSVRQQMCILASNFYNNIHKKLVLIGVTGTNGKTSITFILKNALEMFKEKVGIIGTTGYYIGNKRFDNPLTTPDPLELHKILYNMYINGVKYVIMEVSAHSVYFDKIYGLSFEYGIFTNLTQDHLDFFKTMENYARYKYKFLSEYCKNSIINIDDEYGNKFKRIKNVKTYAINKRAKYVAKNIKMQLNKLSFELHYNKNIYKFNYSNSGIFNVYNVLPCIILLYDLGYSIKKIKQAISKTPTIKGRMDLIKINQYIVCIDYAHTPDALYNILKSLRDYTDDLIVVFGSSGNRDSLKRREMGTIVNMFADFIILTSDNPRYENEKDIIFDLSKDITKPFAVETDRRRAIKYAGKIAKSNSIIVICGKGVERYQDIKAVKVEYCDYDEVEKLKHLEIK